MSVTIRDKTLYTEGASLLHQWNTMNSIVSNRRKSISIHKAEIKTSLLMQVFDIIGSELQLILEWNVCLKQVTCYIEPYLYLELKFIIL